MFPKSLAYLMTVYRTLKKIFIGPKTNDYKYTRPAIQNQWKNFKKAWNDKKEVTFGIERVLRLLLILIQFVFPALYIRHFSGKKGLLCRKIWVELYVILKVILPVFYLYFNLERYDFVLILNSYLILETVCYLLGLIFMSDIYVRPISQKRSFLLLMLNYIEISLCFSILYKGLNLVPGITNNIQAIYFSFVTSTTLGYGEFKPFNEIGQMIVVLQLLIMTLFVFLFFNTVSSKINDKNHSFKK